MYEGPHRYRNPDMSECLPRATAVTLLQRHTPDTHTHTRSLSSQPVFITTNQTLFPHAAGALRGQRSRYSEVTLRQEVPGHLRLRVGGSLESAGSVSI